MSMIPPKFVVGWASCALAGLLAVPIAADDKVKADPMFAGWGQVVDPDHDSEIALKGNAVTIKVPGTSHDFASDIQIQNSPRVLSSVEGDFIAEVKVSGSFKPGPTSTIGGRLPYHGAGLLLIKDKDNYISLHRGCVYINERLRHYANFELRQDGDMAVSRYEIEIPDEETYLRLERRGNRVFNATSPDGVHWTSYDPITLKLPKVVQFGIVVVTSSNVPLSVRFEDLDVFRKTQVE